jgi:hypothetical protein
MFNRKPSPHWRNLNSPVYCVKWIQPINREQCNILIYDSFAGKQGASYTKTLIIILVSVLVAVALLSYCVYYYYWRNNRLSKGNYNNLHTCWKFVSSFQKITYDKKSLSKLTSFLARSITVKDHYTYIFPW